MTATQSNIELRYGKPVVQGDHAAEWWATLRNSGADVTLPGSFTLVFAENGLCRELREYWAVVDSTVTPPDGWGS